MQIQETQILVLFFLLLLFSKYLFGFKQSNPVFSHSLF